MEGQTLNFRCEYRDGQQISAKYFSHDDGHVSRGPLILTDKHNQWVRDGRFSLYDNTTGAFFIVSVDKIESEDSGTYWCGVKSPVRADDISFIQLNVSRGTVCHISQHGYLLMFGGVLLYTLYPYLHNRIWFLVN